MTMRMALVERWEKDGRWHYTEPYEPTEMDRLRFPTSYPPDDKGPFFKWALESFNTADAAVAALRQSGFVGGFSVEETGDCKHPAKD